MLKKYKVWKPFIIVAALFIALQVHAESAPRFWNYFGQNCNNLTAEKIENFTKTGGKFDDETDPITGFFPAHMVTFCGDAAAIKAFAANGGQFTDVPARNKKTPLMPSQLLLLRFASAQRPLTPEIIKEFAAAGGHFRDIPDANGNFPGHVIALHANAAIIDAFIAAGGDFQDVLNQNQETPGDIIVSPTVYDPDAIAAFLKGGGVFNKKDFQIINAHQSVPFLMGLIDTIWHYFAKPP